MIQLSKYITVDPEICHGKPCFKGTRIMVYLILEMLEAGMTPEEILEGYPPLSRDAIQDALHFAAELTKYPPYAATRVSV